MREIKFRAWDIKYKMMLPIAQITANSKGDFNNIPDRIPMQFTGLFDKSGKEIYEGDIVYNHAYYNKWEIVFAYGAFGIWWLDERPTFTHNIGNFRGLIFENNNCEVIGNIYSNPELINNQKEK